MASSINASTSGPGGVITTADNSGILNLQSGGTTVATVNSSGLQVTTLNSSTVPTAAGTVMVSGNMPTFFAWQSVAQTYSSTSVVYKVTYDTTSGYWNTGAYNTSTSTFQPTVAGYYQVSAGVGIISSGGVASDLYLYKNGSSFFDSRWYFSGGNQILAGSWLVYLNGSTDYLNVYVNQGYGNTVSVAQSDRTYFSAVLVRTV